MGWVLTTVCMSAISSLPPPPLKGLAEINKKSQNVKANLPLNFPTNYRSLETARVADGGCGRLGASALHSPGPGMTSGPSEQRPGFVWTGASARVPMAGPAAPLSCRLWSLGASGATPCLRHYLGEGRCSVIPQNSFPLTSREPCKDAMRCIPLISSSFHRRQT